MAKTYSIFSCQQCGAQSPKWIGRCPDCGKWNTYVEEIPPADDSADSRRLIPPSDTSAVATIQSLAAVETSGGEHTPLGIAELDRVLGGGLVPGSLTLLGGDPGIGKSTLVLQMLGQCAKKGMAALYISGEESAAQIKLRADRLGVGQNGIDLITENCLETLFGQLQKKSFRLIIVDSIQTLYSTKIGSAPGTVSQVREASGQFLYLAKQTNTAVVLIGHVTKDGSLAGPKVLEHMVDTVLYFEGERGHPFRLLRAVKNRFGGTNEIGVFEMTSNGLKEVPDPSTLFLAERPPHAPGSVVVASQEGSRPMLVELQALVCSSPLANPRRTAIGVDSGRVALLVAVVEKIMGIPLYNQDIFLNVAGGMKISEPAIDLGIIAAIVSSARGIPLDPQTIVVGEVGLAGEIRAVSAMEARLNEAAKMGFNRIILPKGNAKIKAPQGVEFYPVATVDEFAKRLG